MQPFSWQFDYEVTIDDYIFFGKYHKETYNSNATIATKAQITGINYSNFIGICLQITIMNNTNIIHVQNHSKNDQIFIGKYYKEMYNNNAAIATVPQMTTTNDP